jgi:hypothetical protein
VYNVSHITSSVQINFACIGHEILLLCVYSISQIGASLSIRKTFAVTNAGFQDKSRYSKFHVQLDVNSYNEFSPVMIFQSQFIKDATTFHDVYVLGVYFT